MRAIGIESLDVIVIPAKAGTQRLLLALTDSQSTQALGSRLRGNDDLKNNFRKVIAPKGT